MILYHTNGLWLKVDFKELQWLRFWYQTFSPSFLCWKHVYILIPGIIFILLAHFSDLDENL